MKKHVSSVPARPRRVTSILLVLAGMLLMLALQTIFFPVRSIPERLVKFFSPSASEAARLEPAPWGKLKYSPMALSRPSEYILPDMGQRHEVTWTFAGFTEEKLEEFFNTLDLEYEAKAYLQDRQHWQISNGVIRISPPPAVILSLSPLTREKLYTLLAKNPENQEQHNPFRFRIDGFDDWFKDSKLPQPKIELVQQLVFTNAGTLCFADSAVFSQLSKPEETMKLFACLSRVSTFTMRLQVDAKSDLNALANYWSWPGNAKNIRPLLDSIARQSSGELDVAMLLPTFARSRLYMYPNLREPSAPKQDCVWTSMNFFSERPDDRYFNPTYIARALKALFVEVQDNSRRFGDVLVLAAPDERVIHMCVHIADDVVFTKNGIHISQPWHLMKVPELLANYEIQKPFRTIVYRRKPAG